MAHAAHNFARFMARPPGRGVMPIVCRVFDVLAARWDAPSTQRRLGTSLVLVFLGALATIELARRGWLPASVAAVVPPGHFAAVGIVFSVLLVLEVAGLVFALARSVAESLGKQLELLALILIRDAFVEFGHAGEPIAWADIAPLVPHIVADMFGALTVFALLVPYERVQRHRAITAHGEDQASFVCAKKAVSVLLLGAFVVLGAMTLGQRAIGELPAPFFATFYTVLVLSDVLLVLVSLRYSGTFHVVFRNSAFAAAAMLMRLALSAPPYVNVALAVGGALFALGASATYNAWVVGARAAPRDAG